MKQTKFHVVFNRKNTAVKGSDEALIYIDCSRNGERIYLSTGIKIQKKHWKGINLQWVVGIDENHANFNKIINSILSKLSTFDTDQLLKNIDYPVKALKEVIKIKPVSNFIEYYDNLYKNNSKLHANTKKYYKSALNHLTGFGKIIYFSDINYINFSEFDKYLYKQGLKDTTISKYHKAIKSVINEARKSGFIDKDIQPYKDIKTNAKATEKVFLTETELKQIENCVIENDNWALSRSKDMFLMCAYTGLRYSDIVKLNNKTIHFEKDIVEISLISEKTQKPFRIKLNDFFKSSDNNVSRPVEIILKYKNYLSIDPFKLSDQYYNRQLKKLAKLANINKHLTSHVARHTFGTYMARKVNPFTLKSLMQHSKIETTNTYVHISENDEEVKNIDWS